MTVTAAQRAAYLARVANTWPALGDEPSEITIRGHHYRYQPDPMPGQIITRIGWLTAGNGNLGAILRNHTTGRLYVTGIAAIDDMHPQVVHDALTKALRETP